MKESKRDLKSSPKSGKKHKIEVININTKRSKIYQSIAEAHRDLGISYSSISNSLRSGYTLHKKYKVRSA